MKFVSAPDFQKLELLNPRMQNVSAAPSSPVTGQFYYDTDDNTPYFWDGGAWTAMKSGAPTGAAGGDLSGTYPNPQIATGVIVNADINAAAAIVYSKLNLATSIVNADIAGAAAIARSKLDFGSGLVNADIATGAAIALSKLATDPLARANHTGTQTASTISDLATVVKAYRHDEFAAPNTDVSWASHKITNLLDPTSAQDAATKAYVDAMATGLDIKASVRAATAAALPAYTRTGNVITASANGALAAIDGVTLAANDRLLLKNGAAGADNGIYVVTTVGTGGTPYVLTRATDADSSAEVTPGMFTFVEEGTTLADTGWVLTTNAAITLNTTALTFAQFSGAGTYLAGSGLSLTGSTFAVVAGNGIIADGTSTRVDPAVVARKYSVAFGDGSATSYVITHNLNTRDVVVVVYLDSGTYEELQCDVEHTSVNTITLRFAVAPTTNQYHVAVHG